jgi:hypothetical protein
VDQPDYAETDNGFPHSEEYLQEMADTMARVAAKAAITFHDHLQANAYFSPDERMAMTTAFIRSMSRG